MMEKRADRIENVVVHPRGEITESDGPWRGASWTRSINYNQSADNVETVSRTIRLFVFGKAVYSPPSLVLLIA